MIKWLKRLFTRKKNEDVEKYIIMWSQTVSRYNIRDKKGRFTKRK